MEMTQKSLEQLATTLASNAGVGQIIELVGDVGAGKTTFAKAYIQALGINEAVHSPTFTISNRYESSDGRRVAHYDFYRLLDPGIMRDELDQAITDADTDILIEWGDVVSDILPDDRLRIGMRPLSEHTREVSVAAFGKESTRLAENVA